MFFFFWGEWGVALFCRRRQPLKTQEIGRGQQGHKTGQAEWECQHTRGHQRSARCALVFRMASHKCSIDSRLPLISHFLSFSLFLWLSVSFSLSPTISLFLSFSLSLLLSYSLTLSHSLALPRTLSLSLSHSHSLPFSPFLSLSRPFSRKIQYNTHHAPHHTHRAHATHHTTHSAPATLCDMRRNTITHSRTRPTSYKVVRGLQRCTETICLMRANRQTGNWPECPCTLARIALRCRCVAGWCWCWCWPVARQTTVTELECSKVVDADDPWRWESPARLIAARLCDAVGGTTATPRWSDASVPCPRGGWGTYGRVWRALTRAL